MVHLCLKRPIYRRSRYASARSLSGSSTFSIDQPHIQILILGVSPVFWYAVTAKYGSRHVLLLSVLDSTACNIAGAKCTTYSGQMAARVVDALIISRLIGMGSGIVIDLCPPQRRAEKLGWWVVLTIMGTPCGPFIFGFVAQYCGVNWVFWIFAMINAVQMLAYLILGEETVQIRPGAAPASNNGRCRLLVNFFIPRRIDPTPFKVKDFISPILLARHPKILIPSIASAIVFCYARLSLSVEMPVYLGKKFRFGAQKTGIQFIYIIVGTIIGELLSGRLSDKLVSMVNKKRQHVSPAARLWFIYFGFATILAGLLAWGLPLQRRSAWTAAPRIGLVVVSIGNQMQSTILTAFAIDSYKEKSAEIGIFFNFIRLIYAFVSLKRTGSITS